MHTYRYFLPRWHYALYGALAITVAVVLYRHYVKWNGDWINLSLLLVAIPYALAQGWNELRQVGATLTISAGGIEFVHPHQPAKNWRTTAEEIDYVACRATPFNKVALVVRKGAPPRQLQLAYWIGKYSTAGRSDSHPLMASLTAFFPQRELTRQEAGTVMMQSMELGKVAERFTYAALAAMVAGFLLLFVLPVVMLGDGIPTAAIMAVLIAAAVWAGYGAHRDPTAELRVPMVPLLFGCATAFLFTIAAHKIVYLTGEPVAAEFRLAEVTRDAQIWKSAGERPAVLEIGTHAARYRQPGTAVALEIRRGPFGLDAIHRDTIRQLTR